MTGYMTVDLQGVRLAYRAWGEPDAPPIVLLHGIGGGGPGDWDLVAGELGRQWRVYALDQRGHGRSDRASTYTVDALAADVADFLDAIGISNTILIGHSLGGVVAYLFAARHPDRVNALVVEDAGLLYPRTPVAPERPDGELPFDWDAVLALRSQIDEPDPRWREEARSLTMPTLFVSGGPASYVQPQTIADLADALPQGRLTTIDAGHMVHQERPAEFVAAVRVFLG